MAGTMDLFVLPDCGLELTATFEDDGRIGRFDITGPDDKLEMLMKIAPDAFEENGHLTGCLSPRSSVTLAGEEAELGGIPPEATRFAFVYPLEGLEEPLREMNLASQPWAYLTLLGGFCFFDDDNRVVGVNALTLVPSVNVMRLIGPYEPSQDALDAMDDSGRMAEVGVEALRESGYQLFGWVHARESPGGHELCPGHRSINSHGGVSQQSLAQLMTHLRLPHTPPSPSPALP